MCAVASIARVTHLANHAVRSSQKARLLSGDSGVQDVRRDVVDRSAQVGLYTLATHASRTKALAFHLMT
jgi:hypothetical protein